MHITACGPRRHDTHGKAAAGGAWRCQICAGTGLGPCHIGTGTSAAWLGVAWRGVRMGGWGAAAQTRCHQRVGRTLDAALHGVRGRALSAARSHVACCIWCTLRVACCVLRVVGCVLHVALVSAANRRAVCVGCRASSAVRTVAAASPSVRTEDELSAARRRRRLDPEQNLDAVRPNTLHGAGQGRAGGRRSLHCQRGGGQECNKRLDRASMDRVHLRDDPGADAENRSPVPAQMWAGASPVTAQTWPG
jgi:hypothetical protein